MKKAKQNPGRKCVLLSDKFKSPPWRGTISLNNSIRNLLNLPLTLQKPGFLCGRKTYNVEIISVMMEVMRSSVLAASSRTD